MPDRSTLPYYLSNIGPLVAFTATVSLAIFVVARDLAFERSLHLSDIFPSAIFLAISLVLVQRVKGGFPRPWRIFLGMMMGLGALSYAQGFFHGHLYELVKTIHHGGCRVAEGRRTEVLAALCSTVAELGR